VKIVVIYKEKKSIAHFIDAAAATEDTEPAYTVGAGKQFILESVAVHFGAWNVFDLAVRIYRGLEAVMPAVGAYRASPGVVNDTGAVTFGSGDEILVWYQNSHATEARQALVLITGYEE